MGFFEKRINRIYIVLILPIALFTGVNAIENVNQYLYWHNEMVEQFDKIDQGYEQRLSSEEMDEIEKKKQEYNRKASNHSGPVNNYSTITIALLFFPLIWQFILFLFKWVSHGEDHNDIGKKSLLFSKSLFRKTIKPIIFISILGATSYCIAFIHFNMMENDLKMDRDKKLQDLKLRIETAQAGSVIQSDWEVIGTKAYIRSNDGLCTMIVLLLPDGDGIPITGFRCDSKFNIPLHFLGSMRIKFDNNIQVIYLNLFEEDSEPIVTKFYINPNGQPLNIFTVENYDQNNTFSYEEFIKGLVSNNSLEIQITPTMDHEYYGFDNFTTGYTYKKRLDLDPVWIRFSLKGAKEAITKLGKN